MPPDELENLPATILKNNDSGKIGYLLKLDLHYPQSLHDRDNCYPIISSNERVRYNLLFIIFEFIKLKRIGTIFGHNLLFIIVEFIKLKRIDV